MIKAIIFDMDGLMIDSERATYEEYVKVMEPMGYHFSEEQYKCLLGKTYRGIIQTFYDFFGNDFPMEKVWDDSHKALDERLCKDVPLKKGLMNLLEYLKSHNYKTIVATSSHRARVDTLLEVAGIEKYFDDSICGDEVTLGKPNPEVFLKAAQKLGVNTDEAIVLEDSESGIQASYSASIPVICIPDMKYPEEEFASKTFKIMNDLDEVTDYLKSLDK